MDDTLMESLEPFDAKQAVPFQTAYLSGYLADKYDVDAQQSIERANARIRQSTQDEFRKTVQGYSAVEVEHDNVQLNEGQTRYALYPAWLLNTSWNGQKYTFAMNGQSGKFVGDLPADKGKAALFFVAAAIATGLITYLISKDWMITIIAALIVGGIVFGILLGQLKSVVAQHAAAEYVDPGSVKITKKDDLFLYRSTDRTPIQRQAPPQK